MNIIKSEQFEKYGNDCIIKYDISIIETNSHYDVISITDTIGSWIDKEQEHSCNSIQCVDYEQARRIFKKLIDRIY